MISYENGCEYDEVRGRFLPAPIDSGCVACCVLRDSTVGKTKKVRLYEPLLKLFRCEP